MRSGAALASVIMLACTAHADAPAQKPAPKPAPPPKTAPAPKAKVAPKPDPKPAPKPAPKRAPNDPVNDLLTDPLARTYKPTPAPAPPAPEDDLDDPRSNPLAKVPPGSDPADPLSKAGPDMKDGTADAPKEVKRPPPEGPPEKQPVPPPLGRVWVSSKTAHDQSTLKATDVATKIGSAYLGGVRRCYLSLLQSKPAARGGLTLVFTVNAVGKLADYSVKGFDEGVASCVRKQLADWKFPIPQSTYAEPRNARFTVGVTLTP